MQDTRDVSILSKENTKIQIREVTQMAKVVVMDHPLIQHKIGFIRRTDTGTKDFREAISEIAMLICY